jgi:hypothetical protein
MGGGSKKNKRGSIPSSSSSSDTIGQASTKNELRERTEENDYGIMSDPDENASPIPLLTKEVDGELNHVPVEAIETEEAVAVAVATTTDDYYTQSYTPSEQPQTQHLLQPSSPSSPQQDHPIQPLIQPPKSQNQSLETLQLRLSTDKNFSKKITLHTFFSYVILAIELQRAATATATATATISVNEVETLIEHMIENHSASEEIRTYLRTLNTNGIITNMILAVIDFNKEEKESLDKLFQHEQIELEEMNTLQDVTNTTTNSGRAIVENTATTTTPPPSRSGFFKRMRRFFSGCCG